jgi:hypothetical protein
MLSTCAVASSLQVLGACSLYLAKALELTLRLMHAHVTCDVNLTTAFVAPAGAKRPSSVFSGHFVFIARGTPLGWTWST